MYLVYESLYGDLLQDCDSTVIIGLYNNKEKAIEKAKSLIDIDTMCNNYVLDDERNVIERDGYVRLFYNNQENWGDYYEIFVKKMEVE
jgi:hypothetical protein